MPTDSLFDRPRTIRKAASSAAPAGDDTRLRRALVEALSGAVEGSPISSFEALKQRFEDAALAAEFRSWMTHKDNAELGPAELRKALGGDFLKAIGARADLAESAVLDRLGIVLPRLVNEVTPFGPDDDPQAPQFHLQRMRGRSRA